MRLERTQPPGFEDLTQLRQANLNLYIDGQEAGPVSVQLAPGAVKFTDPAQLIPLLPPLRQSETVLAALQRALPSNAGLSCSPRPRKGCGRLEPEVVGIILSRESSRIDLFLAPSFRAPPRLYLPDPPPTSPTIAGALDLRYGLGSRGLTYTLNQRSFTGFGRTHLAVDSVFSDRHSELYGAYLRHVGNRLSVTGGLFPSSRFSFMYLDRFVGVSVATTSDTRVDRATMADTPLILDGSLSGRVKIYRDGVLLDTQQLAPGRITLDTSRFCNGPLCQAVPVSSAAGYLLLSVVS